MIEISQVKKRMTDMFDASEQDVEKFSPFVEESIKNVMSRVKQGSEDDDRCVTLSAVLAMYKISMVPSAANMFSSFKAGDVQIGFDASDRSRWYDLWKAMLDGASDIVSIDDFLFTVV